MLVRPLGPDDAAAFRALRIRSLREHPEAFGRTPEEVDSLDVWTKRLRIDVTSDLDFMLGAFEGATLVGLAGCHRDRGAKQRHIAHIWGVYVIPERRGAGPGRKIFVGAVERARAWPGVGQVWIVVSTVNKGTPAL